MCLTGVDYFSTLGYQPAIAAAAAGVLSPLATLILVAVTLFGALPVYKRVASESPRGEGSIAMLEKLLPKWRGKVFVLVLLGFAATSFLITMTLSAADASAHLIENPFAPAWLQGQEILLTVVFLGLLSGVFLRGFREAIGIAAGLVAIFLLLNLCVILVSAVQIVGNGGLVHGWWTALTTQHGNPLVMLGLAVLVFPRLALGLSGFETGVVVMPQIEGKPGDTEQDPAGRIVGAHRLLTTAALIMSGFLVTSSIVTTLLIPAAAFEEGGPANGRALAYLAHRYLGDGFGTAYDLSTIGILWFAGASAMTGLLNLVPRYLPRYGMAPAWAKAVRPLVLVITLIAVVVTVFFKADVEAQGGAYATGVLALITSASVAVTLSAHRRNQRGLTIGFGTATVVFVLTTAVNMIERPDGLRIAACFILGIIVISFISRSRRAFELRATSIRLDEAALSFVSSQDDGDILLIAHEPKRLSSSAYRHKLQHACAVSHFPGTARPLFIEVTVDDSSDFETELRVRGVVRHGYRVLEVHSSNVPNTIAAVMLHIRDITGLMPHVYFRWTEGDPVANLFKFLFTGEGEIAPVTREVLRAAEPDVTRRPWVHVG
ncbi:amino acid transporter [Arthrobacter agilis]|uniref:amino acid transporter n=1 Tax=Arthrobacter agilis TaxID=37921 RepID=UPI000B35D393|nr:amino acid transporter [Arthrobacter agilis]OUM40721.1 amino acid transporter [Arthrobacter agilis]PPB45450.1 amino acid transporter [Arthrobacter agilis]TPV28155.1 amino acid transporter [Arthrobacter agilis]